MKDINEDRQEEKTDSIEKAWQASIWGIQPRLRGWHWILNNQICEKGIRHSFIDLFAWYFFNFINFAGAL